MAIVEDSSRECFETFRGHLASLFGKVLASPHAFRIADRGETVVVSLRRSDGKVAVPIDTFANGRLYFHVAQSLRAEEQEDGRFRLRTVKYWYRLQEGAEEDAPSILRWEYAEDTHPHDKYAEHHQQAKATIQLTDGSSLDLDKLHSPCGWVTVEEVLRFLIHDLQMRPKCGGAWPNVLHDAEVAFGPLDGRWAIAERAPARRPPSRKGRK